MYTAGKIIHTHMEWTSFSSHLHRVRVNFFNKMFPLKNSYSSGFLTNSFMMKFHKILKMFLLTIFFLSIISSANLLCMCVMLLLVEKSLSAKGFFFRVLFPPLFSLFFSISHLSLAFIIIMDALGILNY